MECKVIPRRQAIPILYTRGTHYDIGYDMGRTFASMIKRFLVLSGPLNDEYLPVYATEKGRKAYNETLESVKNSFPQYIRELEGIAQGAEVEFHKLFLLHMDNILPNSVSHVCTTRKEPTGCSSIILNGKKNRILAHTEDALTCTLNNYYFVVAHVINDTPQGRYGVKEERFMSLCYAGHLPGYTMSYNHHGVVFSINTIFADCLRSGKTPRHFLTRALLGAENYDQVINVLKDEGVGAADGCSINIAFLKEESFKCYNIEIAPTIGDTKKTPMDIHEIDEGQFNCHANQYERIKAPELQDVWIDSSLARMKTFGDYPAPETYQDVITMLGDCSHKEHCVFRENDDVNEAVKTIAVGVFNLNEKTFTLYSDNPQKHEPHVTLALTLKK